MEYQTSKYFTNEMIDEMIVNSRCSRNSLDIKIPLFYMIELVTIGWGDIKYGLINNYFDASDAIEYSIYLFERNRCNELIIELMSLKKNELTKEEILEKYVEILSANEQCDEEKFVYAITNYIYENREQFEDPFRVIEVLYDDLGFPESMRELVNYVPTKKEISNKNSMFYEYWKTFLQNQKERFLH